MFKKTLPAILLALVSLGQLVNGADERISKIFPNASQLGTLSRELQQNVIMYEEANKAYKEGFTPPSVKEINHLLQSFIKDIPLERPEVLSFLNKKSSILLKDGDEYPLGKINNVHYFLKSMPNLDFIRNKINLTKLIMVKTEIGYRALDDTPVPICVGIYSPDEDNYEVNSHDPSDPAHLIKVIMHPCDEIGKPLIWTDVQLVRQDGSLIPCNHEGYPEENLKFVFTYQKPLPTLGGIKFMIFSLVAYLLFTS